MGAVSNTKESGNNMLEGHVGRVFFRYAAPWALGQLILSSAGLVDGIFVGRYAGAASLAAVSVIFPLFALYFGVGIMLASGGAVRCAKHMAEGNAHQASAMFTKSMGAVALISVLLSAVTLIWSEEVVYFLGARGELVGLSLTYMRGVMWFGPFLPCAYALSYFVRVDQRPGLASAGLTLSAVVNVVGDYLFIVVFQMGVLGAAIATGIAYLVTFVFFGSHFFSKQAKLRLVRCTGVLKETFAAAWNGSSELINELSIGVVIFLTNRIMMERLGADGVAAFAVVNYAAWFGLTLAYGISDSLAPLISANYGARRPDRIRAFRKIAFIVLLGLGGAMFTLFSVGPKLLLLLFLPRDPSVAGLTTDFLDVFKWSFWVSGLNMGMTSFFTGMHRAAQSAVLALLRSLALPILFLTVLPVWWGNVGVYAAVPCAEAVTCCVGLVFLGLARRNGVYPTAAPACTLT